MKAHLGRPLWPVYKQLMFHRREPARFELADYLRVEEGSEKRHELVGGVIYDMPSGSVAHAEICANILVGLANRLKGKACRPYGGDLRVFIPEFNVAPYPDVAVYCGGLEFWSKRKDTVLNPTLLMEVLSPSTRAHDRGEKFEFYQRIPSLQQYVLVHQDRVALELFTRQPDGVWLPALHRGLEAVVDLESIGIQLPLGEVFDGVTLEPLPS